MLKRIRKLFGRRGGAPSPESESARPTADGSVAVVDESAGRPPVHRGPRVVHRPIPRDDLDPDAVKIVLRLTRFDHKAYLVGGCVRDLLLDLRPKDFDIGTSATPRQIKRLFRNSRIIGRRFRLAHIYFQRGKVIEVATFRARDGEDVDGAAAHGDDLMIRDDNQFGTPEEDAVRRDFTINSLFYDINNETVLDHMDGLGDLRRRLVRTIGDAEIRFREDPIRILRAIKFAARLDFRIEDSTLEALRNVRHEIPKAAAPRILEEINRFCRGGAARRSFELLESTGVFEIILPEFARRYAGCEEDRSLMFELLDGIDRRQQRELEPTTGEILTALVLPTIRDVIGWRDGKAEQPRGLNAREIVDDVLAPVARRLRLARKDQEQCRQIVTTLFRMVPARRLRRTTRRGILTRDCLPSALWMLEVLENRFGNDFTQALQYWRRATEEVAGAEAAAREPRPAAAGGVRPERARGRRGGRRRGGTGGGRRTPREAPVAHRDEIPPARVDDDYFFSALPSVPELDGEESGDRYGAGKLEPETPPEASRAASDASTGAASDGPPARRRRRGRRGGRRRRRTATPGTASTESRDDKRDDQDE
jgi:poly(A) polymerase